VSSTERNRRHRRHVRGDHSECLPRSCPDAAAAGGGGAAGPMVEAVASYVATLNVVSGDPRGPLLLALRQLAEVFDARPTAEVSRELRQLLNAVTDLTPTSYESGILEALAQRRDERRAQARRQSEAD
jgi:hypothetical protein